MLGKLVFIYFGQSLLKKFCKFGLGTGHYTVFVKDLIRISKVFTLISNVFTGF